MEPMICAFVGMGQIVQCPDERDLHEEAMFFRSKVKQPIAAQRLVGRERSWVVYDATRAAMSEKGRDIDIGFMRAYEPVGSNKQAPLAAIKDFLIEQGLKGKPERPEWILAIVEL